MKTSLTRLLFTLFSICIILGSTGCRKQLFRNSEYICSYTTPITVPQRSYFINQITQQTYDSSHCGFLPLNKRNYWVYRDSSFNNTTGFFFGSYTDTLRFTKTYKTPDSIIWWEPKHTNTTPPVTFYLGIYHGYHRKMYATDTALYTFGEQIFSQFSSINWCRDIQTNDTVKSDVRWDDASFINESAIKLSSPVTVMAGTFTGCFLYIKTNSAYGWRMYIYFKPGVGIIKSIVWELSPGYALPLHIVHNSELISYHLE